MHKRCKMAVRIVSSDGVEIEVLYEVAVQSKILELFLNPKLNISRNEIDNKECRERPVKLPINSKYLKRIVDYLNYKYRYLCEEDTAEEFAVLEEETMDLLEIASYLKI